MNINNEEDDSFDAEFLKDDSGFLKLKAESLTPSNMDNFIAADLGFFKENRISKNSNYNKNAAPESKDLDSNTGKTNDKTLPYSNANKD